jgi:hypothetical protein
MSTTVSTTMTLTRPTPAAPAPAAVPAAAQPPADLGYLAVVSVPGGLRLPAAANTATATTLHRRTQTGTTYRLDLGDGITCWLDGDQQDGSGELNWVATGMCTALSGGMFAGPDDAPFVCGLALFTGTAGTGPIGLSERQMRRVVDAHAAASTDEPTEREPSHVHALADMTRSPYAMA